MTSRVLFASFAIVAMATLGACQKKESESPAPANSSADAPSEVAASAAAPALQPNPERNAYFGEEHIHTSWSVDAWVIGNRITGPDDALKYAQGQTIKHPMGYDIKIDTPMDFMGVTDHSEYVGVTKQANTPGFGGEQAAGSAADDHEGPKHPAEEQNRVFLYLLKLGCRRAGQGLHGPEVTATVWKENVKIADEQNNHPGKFTAFCSYEWTSMPNNRNLHRNIFFRDCAKVPDYAVQLARLHPSRGPVELDGHAAQGGQRAAGHLAQRQRERRLDVSRRRRQPPDGRSTPPGQPRATATSAWSRSSRSRGSPRPIRCCRPTTSSPATSCIRRLLGLPADVGRIDRIHGSYARQALKDGITMQDTARLQPVQVRHGRRLRLAQHRQPVPSGQLLTVDTPKWTERVERRFAGVLIGGTMDVRLENPGGLTGVWAEENTRASLWDAMYRKETFGVSGPHIKVRFFGGWGYNKDILERARTGCKQSYANGVPMGADLPPCRRGRARRRPSLSGR